MLIWSTGGSYWCLPVASQALFQAINIKEDKKVSVLSTVAGRKVLATLSDIVSPSEVDSKSYNELIDILKDHFASKRFVVAECFVFYSRVQILGESILDFAIAIKHLTSSCKFGTFLKDAFPCDRFVSGIANKHIRRKLLSEKNNLMKCTHWAGQKTVEHF